jgi:hypothetical protein
MDYDLAQRWLAHWARLHVARGANAEIGVRLKGRWFNSQARQTSVLAPTTARPLGNVPIAADDTHNAPWLGVCRVICCVLPRKQRSDHPRACVHAQAFANILRVYMSGEPKWPEGSLGSTGTDRPYSANIRDGSLAITNRTRLQSTKGDPARFRRPEKFPDNLQHPLLPPCSPAAALGRRLNELDQRR